jgi:hypothetical protein
MSEYQNNGLTIAWLSDLLKNKKNDINVATTANLAGLPESSAQRNKRA